MQLPKILAIYLPQFHVTYDNDRWWGEGFTDWRTVQTAEPYFDGHQQPRTPLNGEYYDLLEKKTMEEQAVTAKKYGIDGFCFYHYYFKDGKKELEKPAENLLKWKDIDIPFCFNWASESWIRSWSRMHGNIWAEKYDSAGLSDESGILVAQDFGSEQEWKEHFYYLLPFFKDERYIKISGKPVFIFYSPSEIRCLKSMTDLWRQLAVKEGLGGLYLIGARLLSSCDYLDASLIYEPRQAIGKLNEDGDATINNGVRCYEYKKIWDACCECGSTPGMKTFYSGVVDYDDTPRRGTSGECFINVSAEIFKNGMAKILQKSANCGNELVFINAWNEWGEGMHLEPDIAKKYSMLEALTCAKKEFDNENKMVEKLDEYGSIERSTAYGEIERNFKKFKELFEVVDRWLFLEQERNYSIKNYLHSIGSSSFAIYGMSSLGKHLLLRARKEGIEPAYGIDRYVGQFGDDFKIYRPEEELPNVDCIIITAYDYEEIKNTLKKKTNAKIVYIGEMIEDM